MKGLWYQKNQLNLYNTLKKIPQQSFFKKISNGNLNKYRNKWTTLCISDKC